MKRLDVLFYNLKNDALESLLQERVRLEVQWNADLQYDESKQSD